MSVERIVHEGSLLAVILRIGGGEPGARFVTESDAPLQLGENDKTYL